MLTKNSSNIALAFPHVYTMSHEVIGIPRIRTRIRIRITFIARYVFTFEENAVCVCFNVLKIIKRYTKDINEK